MVNHNFIAYYSYAETTLPFIIFVGVVALVIIILKIIGLGQEHRQSRDSSPPSRSPPASPPRYSPPPRPTRQPTPSRPPKRAPSGYEYAPEPTFEGLNVEEWIKIARRAETDNRPEVVQKATIIIRKLRAMEETQPGVTPEAGRMSAEVAGEKYRIAASQYNIGSYAEAAKNLRDAVSKDPSNSSAWHLLGLTLRAQHEDVGAEQAFRNSIDQDPRNPDVWLSLAELLAGSGRAENARDAANRAIDVAPRAWEGRERVELLLAILTGRQRARKITPAPLQKPLAPKIGAAVAPAAGEETRPSQKSTPAPWEIASAPPAGTPTSIARDPGWDQDKVGDLSFQTPPAPPPAPDAAPIPIKICPFCSNLVQGGACVRCGAKVCRHCGEMSFATAQSCVNCSKDF